MSLQQVSTAKKPHKVVKTSVALPLTNTNAGRGSDTKDRANSLECCYGTLATTDKRKNQHNTNWLKHN